jgi:WD40 repeat protein
MAQDKVSRVDYLGDPLPDGALLRLGTVRFAPGSISYSVLSADDKVIVSLGSQLCGWDTATGKKLWETKTQRDGKNQTFISTMSAAGYGFQPMVCLPSTNRLLLPVGPGQFGFIDFSTGKRDTAFVTECKGPYCSIDISFDETQVAVGTAKELVVCDSRGEIKFKIVNNPAIEINQAPDVAEDRLRFGGEFSYARFSPDGELLVLVNSEQPKALQVLSAQDGSKIKSIPTKARVVRFDFARGGRWLATTERDVAARLYDLEAGTMVWERVFSPAGMDERYTTDIRFAPDDDVLAVGTAIGEDNRIQLLDPSNGEMVGALTGHSWKPWCLNFQNDGKQLFSSGWDSVIRVWDVEKREQVRVEGSERASSVCTLTQDGRKLAYCDDTGNIHVVESQSGRKLRTLRIEGVGFHQLAFSADGKVLAAGGSSKPNIEVCVWSLDEDQPRHHWAWPKGRDVHSSVESLSLTPDSKRLAVAVFRQSKCFVFDLPSDKQLAELRHVQVYGLGLNSEGDQLVTAGWDSIVRLWNVETSEIIVEQKLPAVQGDSRMYGVKYSPDERCIAALHLDGSLAVLDLELNPLRSISIQQSRPVYDCFRFSKNGLWLAVGSMDGSAHIVDVHTGEILWRHQCHNGRVYSIEFGPDDRTLLTGGSDGVNYLWDLSQWRKSDGIDAQSLASDLLTGNSLVAFESFQRLAAIPNEALPAIVKAVEYEFATFQSIDEKVVPHYAQLLDRIEELNDAERKQLQELKLSVIDAVEQALIENWGSADNNEVQQKRLQLVRDQRNRQLYQLSRAFYLVAILEHPDADQQLQQWFSNSPKLGIKKQAFLAKKYRDLWFSRKGSEEEY